MHSRSIRIQYASDLHLEMIEPERFNPAGILKPSAEYLALCGDIGYPEHPTLRMFLRWCSGNFRQVFWVPGNHEYYNQHGKPKLTIAQKNQLMHSLTLEFSNVFLLNRSGMNLAGTNLKIIGCTLWTELAPIVRRNVETYMNDMRAIYTEQGKPFSFDEWNAWHQADVAWLQNEIHAARESGRQLLVLTHHLPTGQLIDKKYHGHPLNYCFASPLDSMIQYPIRAWLCGHSHTAKDVRIHSVVCALNPMGYPGEDEGDFSPQKYLDFTCDCHGGSCGCCGETSVVDGETIDSYVSGDDGSDDSSIAFH